MATAPVRKPWMVEMPAALPASATRPGKPIASMAAGSPRKDAATGTAKSAGKNSAARTASPSAGLTSARMRARLVERLAGSGIRHPGVLAAMASVPRHRFIDEALASRAYEDIALPIGHAQTISQPYIVARMTELLLSDLPVPAKSARVLEIGTGCGYQAAVLAQVVGEVYSIERIRALHERARNNLRSLRVPNLRLVYGDGLLGLPDAAPFDAMLIAAAGDSLPHALLMQLKPGGRALAPLTVANIGAAHRGSDQALCLIVRTGASTWSSTTLEGVRFVPLRSGLA